jgi:prepilin-type N-terminal cleavage/methylation domain-containing protein
MAGCACGRARTSFRIPHSAFRTRRSFTLVELMVVITIIAILATITLGVVGGLLSQARDSATRATLSKVQGLLNSRAQAFDRLTKRKGYVVGTTEYNQGIIPSYGAALPQQSTRVMLATKLLQAKFFPQYAGELYDPGLASPGIYAKPAGRPSIYNPPNSTFVNSEIFYDFLTQSNTLGDSPVASDMFSAAEVKDGDNDGLPEFVDAWGNPLRFYRWPTRLFRSQGQIPNKPALTSGNPGQLNPITTPGGANATPPNPNGTYDTQNVQTLFSTLPVFTGNLQYDLGRDPDDPLQDCYTVFQPANNLPVFEGLDIANLGVKMHTPSTYHVFLVVSAGPDGVLGLYEPDDYANNGLDALLGAIKDAQALTDDIVSLSIRAGGK